MLCLPWDVVSARTCVQCVFACVYGYDVVHVIELFLWSAHTQTRILWSAEGRVRRFNTFYPALALFPVPTSMHPFTECMYALLFFRE